MYTERFDKRHLLRRVIDIIVQLRIPAMWIGRSDDLNRPSKRATLALAIMPEAYSHRQPEAGGFRMSVVSA
jgi:hypothetical protein